MNRGMLLLCRGVNGMIARRWNKGQKGLPHQKPAEFDQLTHTGQVSFLRFSIIYMKDGILLNIIHGAEKGGRVAAL